MQVLNCINDILYIVGAEPVTTLATARQGIIASRAVRDAVRDVHTHHLWPHTRRRIAADSWLNSEATLGVNVVQVDRVIWTGTQQVQFIPYENLDTFLSKYPSSYTENSQRPCFYTRTSSRGYSFWPYPTDDAGRNAINFNAYIIPTVVLTDEYDIDIPVEIENLVAYYASSLVALRLLNDASLSGSLLQLYQTNLVEQRARYTMMESNINQGAIA